MKTVKVRPGYGVRVMLLRMLGKRVKITRKGKA